MKKLHLIVLSLATAVFGLRLRGLSTANGADEKAPDNAALAKRLDQLEADNAELKRQLAAKEAKPEAPEDNSTLAILAKGAGVDLTDVRWRVHAGLDAEQAVAAAVAQKKSDAETKAKAAADAKKKPGEKGGALTALLVLLACIFGFALFAPAIARGGNADTPVRETAGKIAGATVAPQSVALPAPDDATAALILALAQPADRWFGVILAFGAALVAIVPWLYRRAHLRDRFAAFVLNLLVALGLRAGCSTANANPGIPLQPDKSVNRLADAAINRYLIVKVGSDANHTAVAGAEDESIGVTDDSASAAEQSLAIALWGKGPCKLITSGEAMTTAGVPVYQGAGGKVMLSGTRRVGTLGSTSAADGDVVAVIDCVPQVANRATTVAATRTILASEMDGRTFWFGHATEFAMTLPAPFAGARARFRCTAAPASASYTIVTASSANIIHGVGLSSADAGGSASSTAGTPADRITFVDGQAKVGDYVDIESDGTSWHAVAVMSDEDAIVFDVLS
jgi:hypothetical protein